MARDLARRLVRLIRPTPRADLEAMVRWLVARRATRKCLNLAYNRLSLTRQRSFYDLFAKIFRDHAEPLAPGEWRVNAGGKWVSLPLGGPDAWLEWDLAVSMVGHEIEVKRSYLDLIRFRRPRLFFDIGANYGLHSALLLAHGVPTVSFEPNPRCHDYFRRLARRNDLPCDLQPVALGAEEGWAEISFPERETWLGSTNPAVHDQLRTGTGQLTSIRVPLTTLDAFVQRDGRQPDLLKIDTEGYEAEILEGAGQTLRTCHPWVIFESWRDTSRDSLFTLFEALDYRICALPLRLPSLPMVLGDRARFRDWPGKDLIALPERDVR
jgi:FkbM family methyltransferase